MHTTVDDHAMYECESHTPRHTSMIFIHQLVKVNHGHESRSVPPKAKGISDKIEGVDDKNGGNGKEKDFSIGQEGKCCKEYI